VYVYLYCTSHYACSSHNDGNDGNEINKGICIEDDAAFLFNILNLIAYRLILNCSHGCCQGNQNIHQLVLYQPLWQIAVIILEMRCIQQMMLHFCQIY